jgi:hypothetical protein
LAYSDSETMIVARPRESSKLSENETIVFGYMTL